MPSLNTRLPHSRSIRPTHAAALVAALLCSTGCLERKERVTVKPDGAVDLISTFSGDAGEFTEGDVLPAPGSVWEVVDEKSVNDHGDPQLSRTARLSLSPGHPLPDTYAATSSGAEVSLRFPTTLTIENRPDGTYYHFRRTYRHREDAAFTTVRRRLMMDTNNRGLLEDPESATTDEERTKIAESLRLVELDKQLAILDRALPALKSRSQDVGLRIRSHVIKASKSFDLAPAVKLLAAPKSDERDREILALAEQYLSTLAGATAEAVRGLGLTEQEVQTFTDALETEQRRRSITERLAAHVWEVRVNLPGEILASNADRSDDADLVWEFDSVSIMDTDKVLAATSRVAKK